MLTEWWRRWKGAEGPDPSTFLDTLLEELNEAHSLDRRRKLWEEVIRRFVHDVDRACRIAGAGDPRAVASKVLDEALRGVPAVAPEGFSVELDRIAMKHLGEPAVKRVRRSLYLRQFLSELQPSLIPYAEGLLNQDGRVEWLAEIRSETVQQVGERCREAFRELPDVVAQEYTGQEVSDRTKGVWTIALLKERRVP
jgi:hypothetical protein